MNSSYRLYFLTRQRFCVGALCVLFAIAPRAQGTEKKPKNSPPVSLGNNIYILGEDSGGIAQTIPKAGTKTLKPSKAGVTPSKQVNTNARLVQFCRGYLGRKLGNGQCSELAMLGLPAVGAQMDLNRQWGTPVCTYGAVNGRQYLQLAPAGVNFKNRRKADVRPGDIIQYENVKFERRWVGGYSYQSYPHHTSVIEQISKDGRTYKVLEQNVDGTQYVLETVIHLAELTEGTLYITRPIPR